MCQVFDQNARRLGFKTRPNILRSRSNQNCIWSWHSVILMHCYSKWKLSSLLD